MNSLLIIIFLLCIIILGIVYFFIKQKNKKSIQQNIEYGRKIKELDKQNEEIKNITNSNDKFLLTRKHFRKRKKL